MAEIIDLPAPSAQRGEAYHHAVFSDAELDTVLAALVSWSRLPPSVRAHDQVATRCGAHPALSRDEIWEILDRLNDTTHPFHLGEVDPPKSPGD
jgi:hypothetical protein